ncbi:MAG: biotin/lipoyl-containing protein [Spirochaetota bacterium]
MKKRIRFQYDNTVYTVDVEKRGDRLTIEHDGEIYHVDVLPDERLKKPLSPQSALKPNTTAEPSALFSPAAGPPAQKADNILYAPMAGVIKEIKTAVGQSVPKGGHLLVMEAMKMDIDVYAPASGVIKEIYVKPGDFVSEKQKLLRL